MSVAERCIHTMQEQNVSAYQPLGNACCMDNITYGSDRPRYETTVPPRIPAADCFDSTYSKHQSIPMLLPTAFLSFDEFQGYAPCAPLLVKMEISDGLCEIEHPKLGVYGRGETCEEAVVDFLEYLIQDYRAYAEEPEENLDSNAIVLADYYRGVLRRA